MRSFVIILLSIAALSAAGCLVSETTHYTITLNDDGKSGTFTTVMRNMESDSQDPKTQRNDFNELISNSTSDRYLLDQLDKGFYVKQRSLTLDHGALLWKETSLFSDITKLIPGFNTADTMRFPISDTTNLHITTNGKLVVTKDSTFILWPPHTKKFEFTSGRNEFKPLSAFAIRFKEYGKKK
jgi:hypothetical protein